MISEILVWYIRDAYDTGIPKHTWDGWLASESYKMLTSKRNKNDETNRETVRNVHQGSSRVVNDRHQSNFRGELAGEMTVDGRSSRPRRRSSSRSNLNNRVSNIIRTVINGGHAQGSVLYTRQPHALPYALRVEGYFPTFAAEYR